MAININDFLVDILNENIFNSKGIPDLDNAFQELIDYLRNQSKTKKFKNSNSVPDLPLDKILKCEKQINKALKREFNVTFNMSWNPLKSGPVNIMSVLIPIQEIMDDAEKTKKHKSNIYVDKDGYTAIRLQELELLIDKYLVYLVAFPDKYKVNESYYEYMNGRCLSAILMHELGHYINATYLLDINSNFKIDDNYGKGTVIRFPTRAFDKKKLAYAVALNNFFHIRISRYPDEEKYHQVERSADALVVQYGYMKETSVMFLIIKFTLSRRPSNRRIRNFFARLLANDTDQTDFMIKSLIDIVNDEIKFSGNSKEIKKELKKNLDWLQKENDKDLYMNENLVIDESYNHSSLPLICNLNEGFLDGLKSLFKSSPVEYSKLSDALYDWYYSTYRKINYIYGMAYIINDALTTKEKAAKYEYDCNEIFSLSIPGFKKYELNLYDKLFKDYQYVARMIMKDPLTSIKFNNKKLYHLNVKDGDWGIYASPNELYKVFGGEDFKKKSLNAINLTDQILEYIIERNKNAIIESKEGLRNLELLYMVFINFKNYIDCIINNWMEFIYYINDEFSYSIELAIEKYERSNSRGLVRKNNRINKYIDTHSTFKSKYNFN